MKLKGGVRRRLRAWLRDTGSLKVGSPQPSLFTGLPPNPPPIPHQALQPLSFSFPPRRPQDPPMTLPPTTVHQWMLCSLQRTPHPQCVHCHKDLTTRVSQGHLHLATGKMASTSMTVLKFLRSCVLGFLKNLFMRSCALSFHMIGLRPTF